ncbi:cytochrome c biogenesis protein ResB [Mangrovibacterium lignilyticum]|uniref:cytochrome c biogenesis protein ResB n=1 Tax=Mangrovibacterium lignilyticum TaxID=2668052 RepID=UPI0013D2001B|nr:cytochrome c biogenesis protein ResB [Mangrovibacterium lignilyticum]
MKRKTWQAPWSYREGIVIASGLVLIGFAMQLTLHGRGIQIPEWPGNLYLALSFSGILALLHLFYRNSGVVKWFRSVPAAVTSVALYCGLAILMGVIPQTKSSSGFINAIGLNSLTSSWLFAQANLYFLSCLGMATLKRLVPFKVKNLGYILNHLGLWLTLVAASLGSSDLQRLSMACYEGKVEWRAKNENGRLVELPLAIELKDFKLEEYPPKITLIDHNSGKIVLQNKRSQYFSLADAPCMLGNYRVEVEKYLPESGYIGERFEPVNEIGAPPAALLKVTDTTNGQSSSGWISSGSFLQQPFAFKVGDPYSLVMLPPEPKKFQSDIRVLFPDGEQYTTTLEVNKPFSIHGWKLYQLSYDVEKGRWSELSVIELVRDPWLPAVYIGVFLLLVGTLFLLRDGAAIKKGVHHDLD